MDNCFFMKISLTPIFFKKGVSQKNNETLEKRSVFKGFSGAPNRTRTCDTAVNSKMFESSGFSISSNKPIITGFVGLSEINGRDKRPFIFYSTFQSGQKRGVEIFLQLVGRTYCHICFTNVFLLSHFFVVFQKMLKVKFFLQS